MTCLRPNKSLRRAFDPPPIFATAKTAVASNTAELRRYPPISDTSSQVIWFSPSRKGTDTVGESIQAANAAKLEMRVSAKGLPDSQAVIRSMFMATAVMTCCKWVFASLR